VTERATSPRQLPLTGLRVVDLTQILAGPYCTMVLGDLGADVIKVERPDGGDGSRHWGPPFAGGESAYYLQVNRSKRSIAVDLKHPDAVVVTDRLTASADVVIENFLPGAAERYGLDYASVLDRNPAVVYCSIRGYPHDHPQAARPGYDFVMQGEGGIMSMQGEPDGGPIKVAVAISDIVAGLFAGNAILAALVERSATGEGRELEVSLLDAQVAWLANRAGDWLIGGVRPQRLGNAHPSIVPYQTFRTADGHLNLAVGNDDQFARLCRAAGREDLATDPSYATNPLRVEHRRTLIEELDRLIATRPTAEWLEVLDRAGVPGGPVLDLPDVFGGPAAHMVETVEHPTAGSLDLVRTPIQLDRRRPESGRAPPLLGQHGAEILTDLGFSEDERSALLAGPCRCG
jgi:crotonobetainyl-CoA:carnitine CoA-transferase CaiB-like acyl-CoA transferase